MTRSETTAKARPEQQVTLIIREATVVDGTGEPRYQADVAIAGDRIAAIGDLHDLAAPTEIQAANLVLAPGFIDVHTHDDNALLRDPAMTAKVSQGVTTVVTGNCGISLAPLVCKTPPPPLDLLAADDPDAFRFATFAAYVAALEACPASLNAALLVGHSTLRAATMDKLDRAATDEEIGRMRAHLREALQAGAMGFSSGLFYPTSRHAPTDEVVAILEELAGTGAIYTAHLRDEADHVAAALNESFETARRADVSLVVSHHKCMGKRNFGRSIETLALIDDARKRHSVSLDVYPYDSGSSVLLPELLDHAQRVLITWSQPHPELAGRDLGEIAAGWAIAPAEALHRLQPGGAVYHMMDAADVDRILKHPAAMIGSDGLPHDAAPHPRLWGTFPRVLGHFVRARGLLTLEEAVNRMTGLPAKTFGLTGRGIVEEGNKADLVLFDPRKIIDRATYDHPTHPAEGVNLVLVNGQAVFRDGFISNARPGRVLRL